ncbi:28365_t:CDS:2 [Gigaspora margarita]|uniref:28365_t:CDS:1 n=1 Tax=Gigaspora margarita TaxID=4874 RepID=A0ABM8VWG0_GIGMA|nr:28365_t:CDS:2 [Gigaspora margarita]
MMKTLRSIILFYVLVFFGFNVSPTVSDCSYPIGAQIQPSYNPGFTVFYQNTYKIVNNTRTNEVYILYCSASAPAPNVTGVSSAKYFQVPVKNVATLDIPTVTFLELMNVYSSIKYVNNTASITSPCLQKNIENKSIQNFNSSNSNDINVIFSNPTQSYNDNKTVNVNIGDDLTPLQKLEWVKFFSLFYDKEAVVTKTFASLQSIYLCNTKNLANVSIVNKKTIAWVSYDSNSNQFEVKRDKYHAQLIKDAGAYSTELSVSTVNINELHSIINNAYIVIDESQSIANFDAWQRTFGYYPGQSDVNIPDFITNRRVYRVNKLVNFDGYLDWSESSAARPDLAIQDLIAIQYPTYQSSYITKWLYKFSNNDSPILLTSNNCVNPNQTQTIGNCSAINFTGDSSSTNSTVNNGLYGSKKLPPIAEAMIITFSILAGLAGFAVGAWLVLVVRRKHQERFIELKDEPEVPEVQMSNVTEPTNTSV